MSTFRARYHEYEILASRSRVSLYCAVIRALAYHDNNAPMSDALIASMREAVREYEAADTLLRDINKEAA